MTWEALCERLTLGPARLEELDDDTHTAVLRVRGRTVTVTLDPDGRPRLTPPDPELAAALAPARLVAASER